MPLVHWTLTTQGDAAALLWSTRDRRVASVRAFPPTRNERATAGLRAALPRPLCTYPANAESVEPIVTREGRAREVVEGRPAFAKPDRSAAVVADNRPSKLSVRRTQPDAHLFTALPVRKWTPDLHDRRARYLPGNRRTQFAAMPVSCPSNICTIAVGLARIGRAATQRSSAA